MSAESDRIARAGDYVLGLMDDKSRERAERDLEIDPAFREAVMQWAERMHVFDRLDTPGAKPEERWKQIADRIAELPQMRAAHAAAGATASTATIRSPQARPIGTGLHSYGGRRGLLVALGVIVVFALGYLAGRL